MMTAPGNYLLYITLTLGILVSSGYALGRIHQWHKDGLERDEAYRRGYDKASSSILSMIMKEGAADAEQSATGISSVAHTRARFRGRHAQGQAASSDRSVLYPRREERVLTTRK
ncbi:hypothetical protein [Actinoplanes sp. NPDC026619]|uniref:hypothetical protein n=1 Tax=Actinoplanes sp. NPDC026619 TaxID=3155798 RepID=UPI0033DCFAE7